VGAGAAAIVAVTEAGHTARMLAALRPSARIFAATPNAATAARLSLTWGVSPIVTEERALPSVRDVLVSRAIVPSGSVVVFVSMRSELAHDAANFVHVERL
jgi:pyruvate kinase